MIERPAAITVTRRPMSFSRPSNQKYLSYPFNFPFQLPMSCFDT